MTKNNDNKHGLGRRKTAVAQVLLTENKDEFLVNGIAFSEYFDTEAYANIALSALELTSLKDTFGLKAKVSGGGKNAQAEAIKMATARALVEHDSELRKQLSDAGHLRRDPRSRERKKFGLKRARRAPQFSKR